MGIWYNNINDFQVFQALNQDPNTSSIKLSFLLQQYQFTSLLSIPWNKKTQKLFISKCDHLSLLVWGKCNYRYVEDHKKRFIRVGFYITAIIIWNWNKGMYYHYYYYNQRKMLFHKILEMYLDKKRKSFRVTNASSEIVTAVKELPIYLVH